MGTNEQQAAQVCTAKELDQGFYLFGITPCYVEELLIFSYQTPFELLSQKRDLIQVSRVKVLSQSLLEEPSNVMVEVRKIVGGAGVPHPICLRNLVLSDNFGIKVVFTKPDCFFEMTPVSDGPEPLVFTNLKMASLQPVYTITGCSLSARVEGQLS